MGGPAFASFALMRQSKEEKPSAAGRNLCVRNFRDVRKVAPFKGGHRVFDKQITCLLVAKLLGYSVIRGLQSQRPTLGVVRIAGDEVHEALRDPAQRIFLRARTEGSGQ